jgi:hypothetical protein
MQAQIRVDGDSSPEELRNLTAWLKAEDDLRGRVALTGAPPAPGEMGSLADVVTVALSSGGAITVLAGSVAVWLRQRRSDITIEITAAGTGRSVKISADRVADAEGLIRSVLDAEANG